MAERQNNWGNPELVILDPAVTVSEHEKEIIPVILAAAEKAETNPTQSGFDVQTAAINERGDIVTGGNREYAHSRAYVHGEESVSSAMGAQYPGTVMKAIGFYGEGMSIMPCGNCRDVLAEEWPMNLLVTAGNRTMAGVARLSTFLYNPIPTDEAMHFATYNLREEVLDKAVRSVKRGVSGNLPEERRDEVYGALIVDEEGVVFPGSLDTTAGYDATSPFVAARQVFRNRLRGEGDIVAPIETVVATRISEDGLLPHVFYRDRNSVNELNDVSKADRKLVVPARVLMLGLDHDLNIRNAALTDTDKWLPVPFTYKELGINDAPVHERQDLIDHSN